MGIYADYVNRYALDEARNQVLGTRLEHAKYDGATCRMLGVGPVKFHNDVQKKAEKLREKVRLDRIAELELELARLKNLVDQ